MNSRDGLTPAQSSDCLELAESKCAALVSRLRARSGKRSENRLAVRLINLRGVEILVEQNHGMLVQGLDYYDYVSSHVESFARLYKAHSIDPTQQVRLFLVAPDFSQTLVTRCKWFDLPISLFTFTCLKFEDDDDLVPIFTEREIPAPPEIIEVSSIEDHLTYITDTTVRAKVTSLLDEIKGWKPGNISLDPTKDSISMKVNNRVFAYLWPRRQHYVIGTYGADDEWKEHPVKGDDDLANVKPIMKAAMEQRIS